MPRGEPRHALNLSYILLLFLLALHDACFFLTRAVASLPRHFRRRPAIKARGAKVSDLQAVGIALTSELVVYARHRAVLAQLVQLLLARGVQFLYIYDLHSDQRDAAGDVRAALARSEADPGALGADPAPAPVILSLSNECSADAVLRACQPHEGSIKPEELSGKESDFHTQYLYGELARVLSPVHLKEVDLVLVIGPVLTLAGYPFWQIRNSEIHHVGELSGDTVACAERTLRKYFSSMKRFGA